MTVKIHIGRRLPRNWLKRSLRKGTGLISFQTNLWSMIRQSLRMAQRKANNSKKIKFIMIFDKEIEDLHYHLEWIKITIQGSNKTEKEEYEEALQIYKPLGKLFKKDIPVDKNMKKQFKTKILSNEKLQEVYKVGYTDMSDDNLANKMLEMGILTHIELIDDYDSRNEFFPE